MPASFVSTSPVSIVEEEFENEVGRGGGDGESR